MWEWELLLANWNLYLENNNPQEELIFQSELKLVKSLWPNPGQIQICVVLCKHSLTEYSFFDCGDGIQIVEVIC